MTPSRSALLLPLLLVSGCLHATPLSPRGAFENELCVQAMNRQPRDIVQAKVHCDLGLEFDPQSADLWSNKGLIALYEDDTKQAKEDFIKAIRFNQEQASAYVNLGEIYLNKEHELGKAEDSFLRALKVNPDYVEARYDLAVCYTRQGRLEKAKMGFLTLLAVDPSNAQSHHDLGVVYHRQNSELEAAGELLTAVTLAPTYKAEWWNDLGAVEMALSRFSDAVQDFTHCVELEPTHPACPGNLDIALRKEALVRAGQLQEGAPRGAQETGKASSEPPGDER